ncbi:DUF2085 domain-containing protein [Candidatus Bathyarchaeota archaeon]|nr:DUF2085 domain-containing protein [Candidatus Bathyarchaeota archaeon]
MDWRHLLRHNHWITIRIGKTEVGLCARCSGTVLGYFSALLLQPLTFLAGFDSLAPLFQVIFAFLLALPSGIDWVTQTWGVRMSTNPIRFSLGLLIGGGVCVLGLSSLPNLTKLLILSYSSVAVVSLGYLGKNFARTNYGRSFGSRRRTVQTIG